MKCPQCGYEINEKDALRCPRCFKSLLPVGGCSNCGKCNKGQLFKKIKCAEEKAN